MFMDVLEALALRLVVQEQLNLEKDRKQKEREQKDSLFDASQSPREGDNERDEGARSEWHLTRKGDDDEARFELEEKIKKDIKNDINRLEFQESVSKLRAVKEVVKDSNKAAAMKKKLMT